MSIVASALMCHAPIVVPDVVGARGEACALTTRSMRGVAERIVAKAPAVVVLVSPHTPRRADFALVDGPRIAGDYGDFGAPEVVVDLPVCVDARARLVAAGVELTRLSRLDHGALVPLWFLVEAGWTGPTLLASLPRVPSAARCRAFGEAIAAASAGERWVFVASGDCSHRLIPGAPAGFALEATDFDAALVHAVRNGDNVTRLDPDLRALAAEDVVDTVTIAAAASGDRARGREVLSYEGPFGVGYLVAWLDEAPAETTLAADVLVDVARDALEAHLSRSARKRFDTSAVDALSQQGAFTGAFVTWRAHGALRGCVGRMQLDRPVSEAVAELAVASASQDPRFDPVRAEELSGLSAEVSLVCAPEDVAHKSELDPRVWGVEVRAGSRHGVLLPAIDGVDEIDDQIAIVLKKAGIGADERYTLRKFRVKKLLEA